MAPDVHARELTVSAALRGSARTVSMRSILIAGVAAVGIAAVAPHGQSLLAPVPESAATAPVAVVPRVSHREVELMAYIPGWTDLTRAFVDAAEAVDGLIISGMEAVAGIVEKIPVVRVLAPQIRIFYYYLIEPLVMYPLTRGALFVGSLDPSYIWDAVKGIATCLTAFVRAQINYFFNGGWMPFAAAAAMDASASLDITQGGESEADDAETAKPSAADSAAADDIVAAPVGTEMPVGIESVQEVSAEEVVEVPVVVTDVAPTESGLLEVPADEDVELTSAPIDSVPEDVENSEDDIADEETEEGDEPGEVSEAATTEPDSGESESDDGQDAPAAPEVA